MNEHVAGMGRNNPPHAICLPWLAEAEARSDETSREQSLVGHSTKDSASSIEKVRAIVWLTPFQTASRRCELASIPDLERALVHPAAVFAQPDDVLRHPLLSLDCKREIL
ncbi:hypothetical protein [Microvirga sp. P5_D2]